MGGTLRDFLLGILLLACIGLVILGHAMSKPTTERATRAVSTTTQYVCWANNVEDNTCGTYGWSKSKSVAKTEAIKLCEEHCRQVCYVDYCEVVKKVK